ncbi:hypothetical protein scyTo_0007932 [Scyliorhinus torazame]|uniref:Uncharacterized protein n=1 Tax=Scyliorhinus torazame TaxID=75743 RepID=A0A401P0Y4_SCYTO|nr:hypothetical protein [Scyliorhinus torazame]
MAAAVEVEAEIANDEEQESEIPQQEIRQQSLQMEYKYKEEGEVLVGPVVEDGRNNDIKNVLPEKIEEKAVHLDEENSGQVETERIKHCENAEHSKEQVEAIKKDSAQKYLAEEDTTSEEEFCDVDLSEFGIELSVSESDVSFSSQQFLVLDESAASSHTSSQLSTSADLDQIPAQRNWKRTVLLMWKEIASHRFASLFLNPVTEERVPGYHSRVRRSRLPYRPIAMKDQLR